MEKRMETTKLCRDYIGVILGLMGKKMETTIGVGWFRIEI